MSRTEGEELLGLWLDDARRRLTPAQRTQVLDAFEGERSGGRPLYLKLAFEEARLWPSYGPVEGLEPGIDGVIQTNLFHRLAREQNHGDALVARTVGYLAASRYGLAEDELLDVLSRDADLYASFLGGSFHLPSDLVARAIEYGRARGEGGRDGQPDDARRAESWLHARITDPNGAAELRRFLDEVLPRWTAAVAGGALVAPLLRSGALPDGTHGEGTSLLAFYHRGAREVGAKVYAGDERGRVVHGRLADYFRFRADPAHDRSWTGRDVRGLSELPYHLTEAARWQELQDTLTDFRFLEHKAAEVGVELPGGDGKGETCTRRLPPPADFDHALGRSQRRRSGRRMPAPHRDGYGLGQGARPPLPWCNNVHAVTAERKRVWLGQQIACPNEKCRGPLRVNSFVVERAPRPRPMETT